MILPQTSAADILMDVAKLSTASLKEKAASDICDYMIFFVKI